MRFSFAYTAVRVRDMADALQFFVETLGMKMVSRTKVPETMGEFAVLQSEEGDQTLEVNWYAPDSPVAYPWRAGEELDHLAFAVENLDEALEYLAEKGFRREGEIRRSENSKWAYVIGPDGIWIEIFEHLEM